MKNAPGTSRSVFTRSGTPNTGPSRAESLYPELLVLVKHTLDQERRLLMGSEGDRRSWRSRLSPGPLFSTSPAGARLVAQALGRQSR